MSAAFSLFGCPPGTFDFTADFAGLTPTARLADKKNDVDSPESNSSLQTGATEPPAAASLVGTLVAERYQVEALLGEGAMGAVYRAKHIHMQKDVALKVLHQTMSTNQEVVKRFEREAVAAGKVQHPNVASASDFGRLSDGAFYLVLEYVAGQSLGGLIEEAGVMSPERASRIGLQIASALSAAHSEGIVHRDLKPENVMLPDGEHEGDIVKVLDFGMAKMAQSDETKATKLTMHGAVYGTPAYMAPEQAAGNEVDHRADLYALGLMLYEMVSGRLPFSADQVMALLVKQMTEQPPPLPTTVPRQLSKLIMKLLEKEPGKRHQTADEVVTELSDFLGIAYSDPRLSAVGLPSPALSAPRAAAASVAAMKDQVVEGVAQLAPVFDKAIDASQPAVEFLKQPMTVKGKTFPRWVPAAGLFGFLVVVLIVSLSGGDESGEVSAPAAAAAQAADPDVPRDTNPVSKDPDPPDPELAKVIEAASVGSDSALYALEQREDSERSLTEWMGLAQARLMRKDTKKAIAAFREAIKMNESMKADRRMIGALRKLADEDEYAEDILEFVAEDMGALGADMLFEVWAKTAAKTKSTTLAYDLLTSSSVEKHYSPALEAAMELREVQDDCEKAHDLLPRIEEVGDERSLVILRKMHKTRGCGDSKRKDCYPCMRDDEALTKATTAAGMRKAHRFELKNWRWKD